MAGNREDRGSPLELDRLTADSSVLRSERVELAEAIAERLQGRQLANLKQNREGNISHSEEQGRTKDIAAANDTKTEVIGV